MSTNPVIQLKRAYAAPSSTDGYRIYIDRLWPQGLSHETFPYDLWDKDIAPSADLRHWFHQNPSARWPEFVSRYEAELKTNPALSALRNTIAGHKVVTLLYSSHDSEHNNAVVLRDVLEGEH